jgi:transposase
LLFPSVLLPVEQLALESVQVERHQLTITAAATVHAAACPACRCLSTRKHSRYTRTIADLPCLGRALVLHLWVRRFFCDAPHCPRKIFAERFGTELAAYARRTARLLDALRQIAFATGGHGGARLAHTLAMPASPRTLLRLMHAQLVPPFPAPRVVGLDEWAWKKGRNYGTLCVDLERRQPIDLLPDRSPESIAAWLTAHPTIEIITRDRSGGYTDGANRGAPQATQVADRWHLLRNLSDAVERFFLHKRQLLKQAAQASTEQVQTLAEGLPALKGRFFI